MKHTITRTIPEGEFCDDLVADNLSEPCPFLIGEMHSMCFVTEGDLDEEVINDVSRVIKHEKCPARKSFKLEITGENVAAILRSNSFKSTPETVKAILEELESHDVDFIGMAVSEVLYNDGVPTLETLEPE